MSTSSSVIRRPVLSETAVQLSGAGGTLVLDPLLDAEIERRERAAYERGRVDGEAAARGALEDLGERLGAGIAEAGAAAVAEVRSARVDRAAEVADLALDIARAVVGSLPDGFREGLGARLEAALDQIDDEDLVVDVHPDDVELVARLVADVQEVRVEGNPSLVPGDARVRSRWARADLTLAAAWSRVEEELRG